MLKGYCVALSIILLSRRQVEESRKEAEKEGIVVPRTVSEYCIKTRLPSKDSNVSSDIDLFMDDDYEDDDHDDEYVEDDDAEA